MKQNKQNPRVGSHLKRVSEKHCLLNTIRTKFIKCPYDSQMYCPFIVLGCFSLNDVVE